MTVLPPADIALPQQYTVPTATGGGTQLPAEGTSIINFGSVTVFLVPKQELIGNQAAAAPLVQGASIPWPDNVTCYAFTASQIGQVYVSPIQSSVFPVPQVVGISGQPIGVTVTDFPSLYPGRRVGSGGLFSLPGSGLSATYVNGSIVSGGWGIIGLPSAAPGNLTVQLLIAPGNVVVDVLTLQTIDATSPVSLGKDFGTGRFWGAGQSVLFFTENNAGFSTILAWVNYVAEV